MSTAGHPVFTIGHSTHSLEAFLAILQKYRVMALADVRSAPYSRFSPQFNRKNLEDILKLNGIKYVFLGRELGARSDDPSCYENGRIRYERLSRTALFQSGIERVVRGAKDYRIALMCAEKEPLECHRTLLVAHTLVKLGITVKHILADSQLESHEVTMERLLDLVGLPHEDLFCSKDELIANALIRQERRVAYCDEKLAADAANDTA